MVEQRAVNPCVAGSSPATPAISSSGGIGRHGALKPHFIESSNLLGSTTFSSTSTAFMSKWRNWQTRWFKEPVFTVGSIPTLDTKLSWWNRQTRQIQSLVPFMECGFNSHREHHVQQYDNCYPCSSGKIGKRDGFKSRSTLGSNPSRSIYIGV